GAGVGAIVGIVVVPAAICLGINNASPQGAKMDAGTLAAVDAVVTLEGLPFWAGLGAIPGVLVGGGVGVGLGAAGVVEPGPKPSAFFASGDGGLWDNLNVWFAGGARRVGPEAPDVKRASPPPPPPPLAADPADR